MIIDAHGLKERQHLFDQRAIISVPLGVSFPFTHMIVPCDQVQMVFQITKNTEVHVLVITPHASATVESIQHVVAAHLVWREFEHMLCWFKIRFHTELLCEIFFGDRRTIDSSEKCALRRAF